MLYYSTCTVKLCWRCFWSVFLWCNKNCPDSLDTSSHIEIDKHRLNIYSTVYAPPYGALVCALVCNPVLPREPKFGRKTQKGWGKILWGRKNWGRIFARIIKRAERGTNFLYLFFYKNSMKSCKKIISIYWFSYISPTILLSEPLKKQ
jgi:hypothetical protein